MTTKLGISKYCLIQDLCTLPLCNIVSQKSVNFATRVFDLLRREKEMLFKHQTVQLSCKHSLL
jgi:hypothetical protein